MVDLPQPDWTVTERGWKIVWSKLPEASKVCKSSYAVVARKAAEQIANASKLH